MTQTRRAPALVTRRFARPEDLGLTKAEFATLRRLSTPQKIQDFLSAWPQNFEPDGQTCLSVREVLRQRRAHPGAPARLLNQILGLEAKMRQYEEGERFIRKVRVAGGPDLVATLFEGPEHLPSMAEVLDPEAWLRRVGFAATP